jgi:hypothetical protein
MFVTGVLVFRNAPAAQHPCSYMPAQCVSCHAMDCAANVIDGGELVSKLGGQRERVLTQ